MILDEGGAESGALGARSAEIDADLARLIDLWPALPPSARRSMLAVAEAAIGDEATKQSSALNLGNSEVGLAQASN